ncbi:NlpC/P60 family protein [Tsukamurella soli]|uniref:Peptidoglycan hydrolase RipC n=1 Tax=Tsukamurella soli TaxID=644556 RepID=A0ABP8JC10_9ACTN
MLAENSRARFGRVARGIVIVAAAGLLTTVTVVGDARADPADSADAVLKQYRELSHKAEEASEASAAAQIDLRKKTTAKRAADAALVAAKNQVAGLVSRRDALQTQVDALVRANYMGGRTNRLYALLVSDSPQQMLDQMSTLDFINRDVAGTVKAFVTVEKAADVAEKSAESAASAANTAADQAQQVQTDWQRKKAQLAMDIVRVKAMYDSLTGAQRSALVGPVVPFDPRLVPKGTSPQLVAVQAALSRIGDTYIWGATGPSQFDCSGLMMWAYRQAGVSLPRTSQAQLAGGRPVSRDQLQPGDLIIYYSSASHVGMYIGNGFVVHAPTFGVPVQVVPIDRAGPYDAAVRY